jgi:hypothetical protein
VTLTADSTPPVITSLVSGPFPNVLAVHFDDDVDEATAGAITNYSINGLTVLSAFVTGNTVFLTTSPQAENSEYTLTASGIKDLIGNVLTSGSRTFRGVIAVPGSLRVDIFRGISGTSVDLLTNSTRYPYLPDQTIFWTNFGVPNAENFGDNYGALISGFVLPPTNGNYKFFLRSDDSSELYLSTNRDPANLTLIAQAACCGVEWDPSEGPSSAPIPLVGGEEYFVMALLKEGGVNDYIQVAWRTPNDPDLNDITGLEPIPGAFLALAQDPNRAPTISITGPTNFSRLPENQALTLLVDAADPEGALSKVEFFVDGTKLGESTNAPYSLPLSATQLVAGRYVLTARATDAAGVATTSEPVALQIGTPPEFILFVAATSGPNPSDQLIIDRLSGFGYEVRVVGDTASAPGDASFASAIVISASVGSGNVGNKFRDLPFPVAFWEQGLEDNFRMTPDVDLVTRGTVSGQSELNIVNSSHALAAGLTGTVAVVNGVADFSFGIPATNATIVAQIVGSTNQAAIYGFDQGDPLLDGTPAPARRVYVFMTDNTYADLNSDGQKLVDAAFSWALGKPLVGGDRPELSTERIGTQLTITWTNGGTLETAESVTGPWTSTGDSDGSFFVDLSTAGDQKFYRVNR